LSTLHSCRRWFGGYVSSSDRRKRMKRFTLATATTARGSPARRRPGDHLCAMGHPLRSCPATPGENHPRKKSPASIRLA